MPFFVQLSENIKKDRAIQVPAFPVRSWINTTVITVIQKEEEKLLTGSVFTQHALPGVTQPGAEYLVFKPTASLKKS